MQTSDEHARHVHRLTSDRIAGRISEAAYQRELKSLNRLREDLDVRSEMGSSALASTLPGSPRTPGGSGIAPGYSLDEYRLDRHLGSGAFGQVWQAFSEVEGRYVAVKILPPELSLNEREMRRVRDCFQTVHRLQHEHICPVYRLARHAEHGYYLVMKYIDGVSLDDWRDSAVAAEVPLERTLDMLDMIARALDYAHLHKVVHRDVKPGNILASRAGDDIQIVDFGLAEQIHSSMSRISASAEPAAGTPAYMSPEACNGEPQDARSDQYSLACLSYYLVAGRPPFQGSPLVVINCHREQTPHPLENISDSFNAALLRGLAKQKSERYASCSALIAALRTALDSRGSKAAPAKTMARSAAGASSSPNALSAPNQWRTLESPAGHKAPHVLAFARHSNQLIAAFRGGTVIGWLPDNETYTSWKTSVTPPLTGAVFTAEGGFLITSGTHSLVVTDALLHRIVTTMRFSRWGIVSLRSLGSSREVCCVSDAGAVVFVDLVAGKVARTVPLKVSPLGAVGVSQSGKRVVAASGRKLLAVGIGGLFSHRIRRSLAAKPRCTPLQVCFSPDDQYVGVRHDDGSIRVLRWSTDEHVDISVEPARLVNFTFSSDNRTVLALGDDAVLHVFDMFSGQPVRAIRLPAPGSHLACSMNGRVAVALADSGFVVSEENFWAEW